MKTKRLKLFLLVVGLLFASLACYDDIEVVDGGVSTTGDQMIYEAAPTPHP